MKSKWVKIGDCAVDSGTLMIVDPCYVLPDKEGVVANKDSYTYEKFLNDIGSDKFKQILASGIGGTGVLSSTGFGDGCYPVFAKVVDEGDWGERIKEIKIKFY
jgi:hypothetical protein